MRSIASSWVIADWAGLDLHVCWDTPDKSGFSNDAFRDLFATELSLISYGEYYEIRRDPARLVLDNFLKGPKTGHHPEAETTLNVSQFLELDIHRRGLVYDLGYEDLGKVLKLRNSIVDDYSNRYRENLRALRPTAAIQAVVEEFVTTQFVGQRVIGFHVRRGDALSSPDRRRYLQSSDEEFLAEMERQIQSYDSVRIFLASDDAEFQDRVRKSFPSHASFFQKTFVPSILGKMKGGQRAALIECQLLSRTSRIFGTFWSSFGEVAAEIGDVEYSCV